MKKHLKIHHRRNTQKYNNYTLTKKHHKRQLQHTQKRGGRSPGKSPKNPDKTLQVKPKYHFNFFQRKKKKIYIDNPDKDSKTDKKINPDNSEKDSKTDKKFNPDNNVINNHSNQTPNSDCTLLNNAISSCISKTLTNLKNSNKKK